MLMVMRTKQPRVKPTRPTKDSYVQLLEQSLRATQTELSRERSNTSKYGQLLRDQLERAINERDAVKRELSRAIEQLLAYAGRAPISDESAQEQPSPVAVVDSLFAQMFGEDEGNSMFPHKLLDEDPEEATKQVTQ